MSITNISTTSTKEEVREFFQHPLSTETLGKDFSASFFLLDGNHLLGRSQEQLSRIMKDEAAAQLLYEMLHPSASGMHFPRNPFFVWTGFRSSLAFERSEAGKSIFSLCLSVFWLL